MPRLGTTLPATGIERVVREVVHPGGATLSGVDAQQLVARNESRFAAVEVAVNESLAQARSGGRLVRVPPASQRVITQPIASLAYRATAGEATCEFTLLRGASGAVDHLAPPPVFDFALTSKRVIGAAGTRAYAVTGTMLQASEDGEAFVDVHDFEPDVPVSLLTVTPSGAVLVFVDEAGGTRNLMRSADNGATWATVLTTVGGITLKAPLQGSGFCRTYAGTLLFAEYHSGSDEQRVWRSTDDGLTWTAVQTQPVVTGSFRHYHAVTQDPYTRTIYLTSGDQNGECRWWTSDDDGATWDEVEGIDKGQLYLALGMFFSKDHIYYGTDSVNPAALLKVSKADPAQVELVRNMPGETWAFARLGSHYLLGTMQLTESRPNFDGQRWRYASLLATEDLDGPWTEMLRFPVADGYDGGLPAMYGPTTDGRLFAWVRNPKYGAFGQNDASGYDLRIRLL